MAEFPAVKHILKNGSTISLRHAIGSDVPGLQKFVEAYMLDGEGQMLDHDEFRITVERQWERLTAMLLNPAELLLLAEFQGNLVGKIDFHRGRRRRTAHCGEFGLAVTKSWRGQGIGSLLLNSLITWAEPNEHIEKINLHVLSTNERAINLYKKFGFTEEGRRCKDIKFEDGSYADDIAMARFVAQAP